MHDSAAKLLDTVRPPKVCSLSDKTTRFNLLKAKEYILAIR